LATSVAVGLSCGISLVTSTVWVDEADLELEIDLGGGVGRNVDSPGLLRLEAGSGG